MQALSQAGRKGHAVSQAGKGRQAGSEGKAGRQGWVGRQARKSVAVRQAGRAG
jgi:hypothetical protein